MNDTANAGPSGLLLQDSSAAGVLAYTIKKTSGSVGQTIGADGSGSFAVIIHGSPFDAHEKASEHLRKIESQGMTVTNSIFVAGIEEYSGMPIKDADVNEQPTLSATLKRLDLCEQLLREEFEQKQESLLKIKELESIIHQLRKQ